MPQVKKPKKVWFTERLASPKPSNARPCLRWSPTRRIFYRKGKIIESSELESQSDCSNGDNAYTSNPQEPTTKWFPNSTLSLAGHSNLFMFLGTVRFGNDHVAAIMGFGDLQWGNILITSVYFVKGLGHNLALCYPKNDCEDIRKLGAKGDIGFFMGYSANSCAYRISSRLDLTYAPSTITTQQPTEGELDLLLEAMYDDHIGGQPSATLRIVLAAQAPQVLQTPTATMTTADTAPTLTNSSSQATSIPSTSQNVDELKTQDQHVQHQPATIADNVLNAMFDDNTFVNPFSTLSTSAGESSSSQYVDPSNMHTFYQLILRKKDG
ncbi:hypothetical protein Tco_1368507 [Tanacetum coccineum]